MKRRTLLVPLYQLDQPESIRFMELIAESPCPEKNIFSSLRGLGLDKAIQAAVTALRRLRKPQAPAALYWTNPISNLTQVDGVTLALAIGAWAMAQTQGYQRIIVCGRLTVDNQIVSTGYWQQTYAAILGLPSTTEASCLIVPFNLIDNPEQQTAIQALGIAVYPVATLDQALHFCFCPLGEWE